MYTQLVSNFLFPLHEKLKGHHSVALRQQLEQCQWLSPKELYELQARNLQGFIQEITSNVPFYRRLFAEWGLKASDIQAADDLKKLPLLDKPTVRRHFEDLKSERTVKLRQLNTGGSSGEPLIFMVGEDRVSHDVAAKWRATRWWDVDIGDPELVVWGSPVELGAQDRFKQWRDKMLRTALLPAFEMTSSHLDQYIDKIRRQRPRMLFGYPSSLALIARRAQSRGISLDQLGIRVAFVTSECLYDDQRQIIEQTFGCLVANGYGGRDAGFIAHQCPHGGMHISAEHIVLEVLDSEGKQMPSGVPGEITITHLSTASFPFLRYRTGDIGVLTTEPCPCGRGLPQIKALQGRSTDMVVASDGTVMHALALIYEIREEPGVAHFKLEQHSLVQLDLQLVFEPGVSAELLVRRIVTKLKRRLGDEVNIRIEVLDQIQRERSGKYRHVISHVAV